LKVVASFLRIAVAVALLLPLVLYFSQDSLLFQPQPLSAEIRAAVKRTWPRAEELEFAARDGTRLHGWFFRNGGAERAPVVIYFGGNAEEISGMLLDAGSLEGVAVAAINYRGYGLSAGSPSEAALFADALDIYAAAPRRGARYALRQRDVRRAAQVPRRARQLDPQAPFRLSFARAGDPDAAPGDRRA
jgi:hypothetical protein